MKHGNDPGRNDPPEVETIQDVRDWYDDPNHIGLPPGCAWVKVDQDANPPIEIISLPSGECWQWDYDLADWRTPDETQ